MPDNSSFETPRFDPSQHSKDPGQDGRRVEKIPVLEEADSVTVRIEILKENYDEMLKVIAANEWKEDEGLEAVLLTGLGYLNAKLKLDEVNHLATNGDARAAQKMDAMVKELAAYHSMYSVMKFKAFKLYKLSQVLEFNVSGLRATERMWEGWADRMRRQHSEQQAELLRLRSLMAEFKIDWDPAAKPHPLLKGELETEAAAPEMPERGEVQTIGSGGALPEGLSFWGRLKWLLTGR